LCRQPAVVFPATHKQKQTGDFRPQPTPFSSLQTRD
jgi:hypothetical protein